MCSIATYFIAQIYETVDNGPLHFDEFWLYSWFYHPVLYCIGWSACGHARSFTIVCMLIGHF